MQALSLLPISVLALITSTATAASIPRQAQQPMQQPPQQLTPTSNCHITPNEIDTIQSREEERRHASVHIDIYDKSTFESGSAGLGLLHSLWETCGKENIQQWLLLVEDYDPDSKALTSYTIDFNLGASAFHKVVSCVQAAIREAEKQNVPCTLSPDGNSR